MQDVVSPELGTRPWEELNNGVWSAVSAGAFVVNPLRLAPMIRVTGVSGIEACNTIFTLVAGQWINDRPVYRATDDRLSIWCAPSSKTGKPTWVLGPSLHEGLLAGYVVVDEDALTPDLTGKAWMELVNKDWVVSDKIKMKRLEGLPNDVPPTTTNPISVVPSVADKTQGTSTSVEPPPPVTGPAVSPEDVNQGTVKATGDVSDEPLMVTTHQLPYRALEMSGAPKEYETANGVYHLFEGQEVNGRPAYRHSVDEKFAIWFVPLEGSAQDSRGWVVGLTSSLGKARGRIRVFENTQLPVDGKKCWDIWEDRGNGKGAWRPFPSIKISVVNLAATTEKISERFELSGASAAYASSNGTYRVVLGKVVNGKAVYSQDGGACSIWFVPMTGSSDHSRGWVVGLTSNLGRAKGRIRLFEDVPCPEAATRPWEEFFDDVDAWKPSGTLCTKRIEVPMLEA